MKISIVRIVLMIAMLGASHMATAATVEQERDVLFKDGTDLRGRLILALEGAQQISVTPREAVLRTRIRRFEEQGHTLMRDFIAYDGRVSALIQKLATTQHVVTLQGAQVPVTPSMQFEFAIYAEQLSGHREAVRAGLRDFSELVASRRSEANSLVALIVSLVALSVSVIFGLISIFGR